MRTTRCWRGGTSWTPRWWSKVAPGRWTSGALSGVRWTEKMSKESNKNNKFISNLRKINLFLVCLEKKSPCWWISTESSAHPPLPRVLGQKARGGADITRGGSRSQHTRSSSRMLKRYSNKDDKYSRVSDCFRRSLAASKWKCLLCTLPRVQRWTRWGKV